jgi:peptidoglycan/xylan/chitin deacetylase (PgdA/CDA1 family)
MWIAIAAALGVAFLAHTAPFPFLLDWFNRDRALWRMPPTGQPPTVYLTFDDGPNPTATPGLLDLLARERVRATFFLIDRHLTHDTAPIVSRMFTEGHAVGLHSHTRALMVKTPGGLADTLSAAAARIEQLAGRKPCRVFRPHAGWRSAAMYAGLKRLDYQLAGWGWMLWDWNWYRARQADAIARRLVKRARDGDVIVVHDGHHINPRADRQYAIDTTALAIPELRAKGFVFGTICGP